MLQDILQAIHEVSRLEHAGLGPIHPTKTQNSTLIPPGAQAPPPSPQTRGEGGSSREILQKDASSAWESMTSLMEVDRDQRSLLIDDGSLLIDDGSLLIDHCRWIIDDSSMLVLPRPPLLQSRRSVIEPLQPR